MNTQAELRAMVAEMADENGEIVYTGNTQSVLNEAEDAGLVRAVSGKFKVLQLGTLSSVYRIVP